MRILAALSVFFLLSLFLSLTTAALGLEGLPSIHPSEISMKIASSPGRMTVSLQGESSTSFQEPVTRYVVLPTNAGDVQVRLADDELVSAVRITAGAPMIMRGLRLLPITISPVKGPSAIHTKTVEIEVFHSGGLEVQQPSNPLRHSKGFFDGLEILIASEQQYLLSSVEAGSYLIITDPRFESDLQPFAGWKREKGFVVDVVTTLDWGTDNGVIQDSIRARYHNSAYPPEYVLLVGDVGQIPGWNFHASVSDLPYALMDGDDWFPDLHVGRLSVETVAEAKTVIKKILNYEWQTYFTDSGDGVGTDWLRRGLVVGADYASDTPVAVSNWCREVLLGLDYEAVSSVYYPPHYDDHAGLIPAAINGGVSIISYRGWAYGVHGWEPPHFTSNEVFGLTNGWMLPAVFSFVCQNNDYAAEGICFGEAWLRAGTEEQPRGAVAFIGNSEPWSHTRFNDAAAIGAFKSIADGARRLGSLLLASKLEILHQFPTELEYAEYEDSSVEHNFYIYNLLGDPEMEILMAPPKAILVDHQSEIPMGANFTDVVVTEDDDVTPIVGARVGISSGNTTLGCAWTDENGVARVPALFGEVRSVGMTVTGTGLAPYRGQIDVVTEGAFAAFEGVEIDDSAGNSDGVVNPGETVDLSVTLHNFGETAATSLQAAIAVGVGAELVTGSADYPDIAPGASAIPDAPFTISVDPDAGDGLRLIFLLEAQAAERSSVTEFNLQVVAPALRYESYTVADDGVLNPGESAGLTVTITNDGSLTASAATAVLRSELPGIIAVIDSASSYPALEIGGSGLSETAFTVQAGDEAFIGQVANMKLILTTEEGYISETDFSLVVGEVDHRAPLAADAYGYYAYDNSDTDYPDTAPLYDWITCSTLYGGSGTRIELRDNRTTLVDVPFPFTFYGKSYDRLMISDNGWASFDTLSYHDYYNWRLPDAYGSGAKMAPFWDNLDPGFKVDDVLVGDGIYTYSDDAHHRFVVEWSRLANERSVFNSPNEPDWDLQTFQLILYDPAYYPNQTTGDGVIEFQYKNIVNNDHERMYSTVGIENETEDIGIEYSHLNEYAPGAAPLSDGLAIRFTTEPPRYDPVRIARFTAEPVDGGILMSWAPCDDRPLNGYRIYREQEGGGFAEVSKSIIGSKTNTYLDRDVDPDAVIAYKIGILDPVGYESMHGPYIYDGPVSGNLRLALTSRGANPFRGAVELGFTLPIRVDVQLQLFDISGRLVRTLVNGVTDPGQWTIPWDGNDTNGRAVSSGLYLAKLSAGMEQKSLKLMLVK
ncbi:MAG: hypothetical protein KJ970_15585 [Candidatus Eisenbacteria bacterium]|uniref:T9SS type A sorting domain-containing protein n=1 Tax=Eiseniibacteriota bacterium TaxID=2212470 RepID=A0A948S1X5_UNCEI|nr:hypothetical protein [Candidatus Eisenbacteria bacterium]MBU1947930.1 hypothetical protein [Candidatus Eisenbacteria bacterium]MBU2692344.1 hypothetical protein [Candidatus Eisenbacteria bacterium]